MAQIAVKGLVRRATLRMQRRTRTDSTPRCCSDILPVELRESFRQFSELIDFDIVNTTLPPDKIEMADEDVIEEDFDLIVNRYKPCAS